MEDLKQIQEFFSKPLEERMSLDDQAKAYFLAKVKSGEIDTLPENPKAAFLAQMTKDQMDHDKETLRRERGLEEGTLDQGEIAIYIGNDDAGTTHIFKRGKGYYGYNDEFDFEAKDRADLEQKLKSYGYELLAGSLDEATKEEETEFHTKLDKLVHKTFGHSSDEKKKMEENALGMTDSRLSSDQHVELDYAVRGDSAYTFGNDPYADDQLRYKYAKKMGYLEEKEEIKEGVWSLGTSQEIKDAIHTLEMWYEIDARQISALFDDKDNSNWFYNVVGDDLFHDYLNRVETAAASDNTDGAHNAIGDAIGRAEELLAFVQKSEGLNEEEAGEADMVASDIQKAMNKHKKDDAKMHQLKQARTAMNKGDLDKAKKIASRLAEKLKNN